MRAILAFTLSFMAYLGQIHAGLAAELATAHTVYLGSLARADEGVHRVDGLLFVILEIPDANKLRRETLEARCLLRTLELLRQYASDRPASARAASEPTSLANAVLRQFPFLLAECRRANPLFGTQSLELKHIASRVVENRFVGKQRRYVTAFVEGDIDKQLASHPAVAPGISETLAVLRPRLAALLEDEAEQAAAFLLRCGAIEDVLNVTNDELWLEFSLASFGTPQWDSLELYERWQAAHELVAKPDTSRAEVRQLLRNWPGFPPAVRWLCHSYRQEEKHAAATNLSLLALVDSAKLGEGQRELAADLERWSKAESEARGLAEYACLLSTVQQASLPEAARLAEHPAAQLVTRVWGTYGHLNLPEVTREACSSRPAFIYDRMPKAKDLTATVKLLYDGLAKNPSDAGLWATFGESLLAENKNAEAIPFLTQSLRLAPAVVRTRLSLATGYDRLGYQQLRRGAALAALLQPAVTDAEREQAVAHLGEVPSTTTTKAVSATTTDPSP
jgi:cytochrome c-type biogenesis protein CcmH/NrfG